MYAIVALQIAVVTMFISSAVRALLSIRNEFLADNSSPPTRDLSWNESGYWTHRRERYVLLHSLLDSLLLFVAVEIFLTKISL